VKLEQEQQFLIAKKLQELTSSKNIKLKPIIDSVGQSLHLSYKHMLGCRVCYIVQKSLHAGAGPAFCQSICGTCMQTLCSVHRVLKGCTQAVVQVPVKFILKFVHACFEDCAQNTLLLNVEAHGTTGCKAVCDVELLSCTWVLEA
jgi:hypothetical protein